MPSTNDAQVDRTRLLTFLGTLLVLWLVFEALSVSLNVRMVQLAPAYMFTPLLAGAVTVWRSKIGMRELGLRIGRGRWLAIAAIVPLLLAGLVTGLSVMLPGIDFSPGATLISGVNLPDGTVGLLVAFGVVLVLGVTVNAVLAFGEEFGWRGYLLWELAPLGFWRASALIGVIWGLWHAPVIVEGYNYPSFPLGGVLVMVGATIAFSFLYTYLVIRAESVLAAVFFHGVFNASGGLVLAYTAAETAARSQLVASPVGAASIAVFLLVAAVIAVTGTPKLDRKTLFTGDR